MTQKKETVREENENVVLEIAKTLGTAVILAIAIRHFIAEARYIPSPSMVPTLQINDRLIIEKISYHFRQPQRGDVVVFSPTDELRRRNFKVAFIKRIIGLPGDTIAVRDGVVYVNNKPIKEKYIEEPPYRDFNLQKVPENQYFVMGDNRNNSSDSREWGFVPQKNIIGRAFVRFWPFNRLGSIDEKPIYP